MNIENQACTKEQAERLAALGITQESYFYHYQQILNGVTTFEIYTAGHFDFGLWSVNESVERAISGESKNKIYSAFTVAEMRQAIGIGYTVVQTGWKIGMEPTGNLYSVIKSAQLRDKGYYEDDSEVGRDWISVWNCVDDEQPLTDGAAHGALLIYLLENNHITATEVNNRLTTK